MMTKKTKQTSQNRHYSNQVLINHWNVPFGNNESLIMRSQTNRKALSRKLMMQFTLTTSRLAAGITPASEKLVKHWDKGPENV